MRYSKLTWLLLAGAVFAVVAGCAVTVDPFEEDPSRKDQKATPAGGSFSTSEGDSSTLASTVRSPGALKYFLLFSSGILVFITILFGKKAHRPRKKEETPVWDPQEECITPTELIDPVPTPPVTRLP